MGKAGVAAGLATQSQIVLSTVFQHGTDLVDSPMGVGGKKEAVSCWLLAVGKCLFYQKAQGHRSLACSWRSLQQEIVASLLGMQQDVVVGRMIGTGELQRGVLARRLGSHQQVALLGRRSAEGHQTAQCCRGGSIGGGWLDGIMLFGKRLRGVLSVVVGPYRNLVIVDALYHTFI